MTTRRTPAIPDAPPEVSRSHRSFLLAVKETLEVMSGRRPKQNPRDRVPTIGDLIDAGVTNAENLLD